MKNENTSAERLEDGDNRIEKGKIYGVVFSESVNFKSEMSLNITQLPRASTTFDV